MHYVEAYENLSICEKLEAEVAKDILDREDWRENRRRMRRIRLGERKRNTIYKRAPNWVVPIVDDNVTRTTTNELNIIFNPKFLAHFITILPESEDFRHMIELGFHQYLTMLNIGTALNILLDNKNEAGDSIGKVVMNDSIYNYEYGIDVSVPDIIHRPSADIVVPTTTDNIQDAQRICDIYRYPVDDFFLMAEKMDWKNANEIYKRVRTKGSTEATDCHSTDDGNVRFMGLNKSPSHGEEIVVHEHGYTDKKGKRHICVYNPDFPKLEMADFEWTWPDTGENKRWYYVQFRREDRVADFYDSRGITTLVKDNQQAASQFKNIQGIYFDYGAKPQYRRTGAGRLNIDTYNASPGSIMPQGLEAVDPPNIPNTFNYNADLEMAYAARRSGSSAGSLSSVNSKRDRKTATESSIEQSNSQMMSSQDVQRFARPLGVLFSIMYEYIRKNQIPLPLSGQKREDEQGGNQQVIPEEAYQFPFLVRSSANSRQSDPIFELSQFNVLQPYIVGSKYIKQPEILTYLLNRVDPRLAETAVVEDGAGSVIEEQINGVANMVQELAKTVTANHKYIVADAQERDALEEVENQNVQ